MPPPSYDATGSGQSINSGLSLEDGSPHNLPQFLIPQIQQAKRQPRANVFPYTYLLITQIAKTMATPNVDLNLRWEDQNVVKKDGQWTVDGCVSAIPTPGLEF